MLKAGEPQRFTEGHGGRQGLSVRKVIRGLAGAGPDFIFEGEGVREVSGVLAGDTEEETAGGCEWE